MDTTNRLNFNDEELPTGNWNPEDLFLPDEETPEALTIEETPEDEARQICITKDGQSYFVRYTPGEEMKALCSLVSMALDPRYNFDLSDACIVMDSLKLSPDKSKKAFSEFDDLGSSEPF